MGSIFSLPLTYWINGYSWPAKAGLWLAILAVGSWSAKVFDELMGTSDNQNVVIDEVLGFGLCAWSAGRDWKLLLAALLLFRFFDIVKPPPVRQVDQWSKKMTVRSPYWGGFGVMFDDVVAGLQGWVVLALIQGFISPR